MSTQTKTLLTVSEAAKVLRLSDVRVRQLCQEGRIGEKIGNQYVLKNTEVVRFSKIDRPAGRKPKKKRRKAVD